MMYVKLLSKGHMSKDQRFSAVSNVSLTSEEATEHIMIIIAIYID